MTILQLHHIYLITIVSFGISLLLGFLFVSKSRISLPKGNELGGISVFPIILIALCLSITLPYLLSLSALQNVIAPSMMRIMQIIVGSSILYIVGLKDDLNGTSSFALFSAMLIAAAMFPVTNLWINHLHGIFGIESISPWIGMPLTVFLSIYIMEMFYLSDGYEGQMSSLGTIILSICLALAILYNFVLGSIVAASTLGVIFVFFVYKLLLNSWKKVQIGSAGSYVIGYIVSYLIIAFCRQGGGRMPNGILLICLGVLLLPSLDLLRVIRSRVRDGRALNKPDRNQIVHKILRAGVSRRLIPFVFFLFIAAFALFNSFGLRLKISPTLILLLDIALWVLIELGLNFFIHRRERNTQQAVWDKEYGREAWEANIPVDVIKKKRQDYGTMGLPSHMIDGKELDFIPDAMSAFERNVKRIVDCVVSGICLIVFSPLFLLSYILIKLDDGGPAIYSQERIGRFGRPFTIYKFRSMRLDAEKGGKPELSTQSGVNDSRLTKVGGFLRAHHLDELPQLWNVFVGDMAFIGYRPERKYWIDQIMEKDPRYSFLYQIRPGVTSYATLYNGYTDTIEKMLRRLNLDLYYLGHRSWWFDIKVLFLTFLSIVFGKKF